MAKFFYSGQSCIDSNVIIVLTALTSYNIGDVVQVEITPLPDVSYDCYSIFAVANSGDTPNFPISSDQPSCLSCFQSLNGSFKFVSCEDDSSLFLNFDDFSFVPNFGGVYYITTLFSTIGCYEFVGWENLSTTDTLLTISEDYVSCEVCEEFNIPTSANTEYSLCVVDCSGNTVNLDMPHPVWTNNYGIEVTQLNAVTLGGPNGLNN